MDNKFENHVKSDKVKWVVVFLAIKLLADSKHSGGRKNPLIQRKFPWRTKAEEAF